MKSRLQKAKEFVESLQAYSTPGKLKNFRYSADQVRAQKPGLDALVQLEALRMLVAELAPAASYLTTAGAVLPPEHSWTLQTKKEQDAIVGQMLDAERRGASGFRQQVLQRLTALKQSYVQTYVTLHKKARLGVAEDKRKVSLMRDPRVQRLQRLATIELMPRQQLTDFQSRLADLKSCFKVTQEELEASPICPHCGFRPIVEDVAASSAVTLQAMEQDVEKLVEAWTATLLTNLEDPTTQQNLSLLKPERKALVDEFLKSRELPDEVSSEFIQAIKEALSGLAKVVINVGGLKTALLEGGAPVTIGELKRRFDDYLAEVSKGKDASKVRIVLE